MPLASAGPAKPKPGTWNGNSEQAQYSVNNSVGAGCNTFSWTFLNVTHDWWFPNSFSTIIIHIQKCFLVW